jgi:hypothetical protein
MQKRIYWRSGVTRSWEGQQCAPNSVAELVVQDKLQCQHWYGRHVAHCPFMTGSHLWMKLLCYQSGGHSLASRKVLCKTFKANADYPAELVVSLQFTRPLYSYGDDWCSDDWCSDDWCRGFSGFPYTYKSAFPLQFQIPATSSFATIQNTPAYTSCKK